VGDGALWAIFGAIVLVSMALDLGVFHRHAHAVGFRESLIWTVVWIALAAVLGVVVYYEKGAQSAAEYATCYLTEKALSIDNLFVFVVLFRFFAIAPENQHRVLTWGIVGALVMRALFIFLGVEMVERFHWTTYVLGAFLVLTGVKLALAHDKELHPDKNPVLRFSKRFMRVTSEFEGSRFFARRNGLLYATPMFLCLLVVETTDVLFAVDSVPAALGISHDRFVLYSSNVMAICGLRALYFAVAGLMGLFRFLQHGLALILVFVGAKMLITHWYKLPIPVALGAVVGILALSIVASLLSRAKSPQA
jgi:tellurite resistance protein TerC